MAGWAAVLELSDLALDFLAAARSEGFWLGGLAISALQPVPRGGFSGGCGERLSGWESAHLWEGVGLAQLVCVWRHWMGGVDMDQEAGDWRSWSVFGGVGTWAGGVDSRLRLRLRVGGIEWLGRV